MVFENPKHIQLQFKCKRLSQWSINLTPTNICFTLEMVEICESQIVKLWCWFSLCAWPLSESTKLRSDLTLINLTLFPLLLNLKNTVGKNALAFYDSSPMWHKSKSEVSYLVKAGKCILTIPSVHTANLDTFWTENTKVVSLYWNSGEVQKDGQRMLYFKHK